MKDLVDEVLQASSQTGAWRIFKEILERERQEIAKAAGIAPPNRESGQRRDQRSTRDGRTSVRRAL